MVAKINDIETVELTKKYNTILAVNNMSLSVKKGELFGLLGPDGAGKTTITQMLCGILTPTSGRASVLGFDTIKDADKIRGKIGYMSEGFSLYGTLTVDENIEFFADLYKVSYEQRAKRKRELLHFSRLTPYVNIPAEKLSGGMKKKLALCCTLIYSPKILFLDEPTLGVDPVSRREFWKILHDFRKEGITIFITTPYMDEAERCDRVALIHKGTVIKLDTPSNMRKSLKGTMIDLKAIPQKKAWQILKQNKKILDCQIFGERIHAQVEELETAKQSISKEFSKDGVKLLDFRKGIPSLEDVFVSAIHEKLQESEEVIKKDAIENEIPLDSSRSILNNKEKVAIKVENLTRSFGEFIAVNNLSMEVKKGEIFGFLGPNGSGKSTTMKMLTGLLMPTKGRAEVGGFDIIKEVDLLKSRIGYMSQKFSLYNDLTVEENINFYAGVYGVEKSKLRERKKWVLDMAGLKGKENVLTKSLSGGWKQRLALGCSILHEPSIIFLDEPTSGVDPIARRHFWDLIYELSQQGITIFVTTHYMDEAEHCHNLGFIYNGNLIAQGSPLDLKKQKSKGKLLEIDCDNPFEAIEVLRQKENGYQASAFGSRIHVMVKNAEKAERDIDYILKVNGFNVKRIDSIPLSLEDLFVLLMEENDKEKNRVR